MQNKGYNLLKFDFIKRIPLPQQLFFSASILTFLGFVLYGFADFNYSIVDRFYNSDTLYIPSIFNDLFIDKIGLSGWSFNIAPNFFPDMIVYFIIHSLTNDIVWSGFLYGVFQNLFIVLIIFYISKQIFPNNLFLKSSLLLLLFSFPFLCMTFSRNYDYSFHLLVNGFHTSSFVLSILSLGIWLHYKVSKNRKLLYLIFIVSLFASLSDKLYVFSFTVPIIIILLFQLLFLRGYKSDRKFFLISILGTLIGIFFYYFIANNTPIRYMNKPLEIDSDSILYSANVMIKYYRIIFSKIHLISVVNVLILLSVFYSAYKIIVLSRKPNKSKEDFINLSFQLFIVFNIICVLLAPILTGVLKYTAQIRYNIFYFYIGIIGIGYNIIELAMKSKKEKVIYSLFLIASISLLVFLTIKKDSLKRLKLNLSYEPGYIEFIDKTANKYNLKKGLSSYWFARQTTFFNNSGIKVYAVTQNIYPVFYTTQNKYWYKSKNINQPIIFNFLIFDKSYNVSRLEKIFGNKKLKVIQNENLKIIITPDFYLDNWNYRIKVLTNSN